MNLGFPFRDQWQALTQWLPRGTQLPVVTWTQRHRGMLAVLWAHALLLPVFGYVQGLEIQHLAWESALLPCIALAAALDIFPRRVRSAVVAGGLITASALVTHFSGGYIEAHFHFFVMVALITLYQDWVPFLLAVGYVAVHHGVMGTIDPGSVYNHADAIANPWAWAAIHATFILGLSVACIVIWRANEVTHEDLRVKEQELANAQRLASLGSWTWDARSHQIRLSDEMKRILGFPNTAQEFTYQLLAQRVHTADRRTLETAAAEAIRTGGSFDADIRIVRAGGEVRWASIRGTCEVDGQENLITISGTVLDITARRTAEDERSRNEARVREIKRLEELDRFKTQFLNHAAHEMGTPLTPIKLQLHMLKDSVSESQKKSFEMLERNFDRVTALTRDLLDAARTQSSKVTLQKAPIWFDATVREAAEAFQNEARSKGITFEVDASKPVELSADARRVSQVLFNLFSNALKFTPKGGHVHIGLRADDHEAAVDVIDSGLGLTAEQAEKLFQPFSRAHDDVPNAPDGNGLGLFISRGIIEAHGGRIWCQSAGPGRGSTFTFTLPREIASDSPATQLPSTTARSGDVKGKDAGVPTLAGSGLASRAHGLV